MLLGEEQHNNDLFPQLISSLCRPVSNNRKRTKRPITTVSPPTPLIVSPCAPTLPLRGMQPVQKTTPLSTPAHTTFLFYPQTHPPCCRGQPGVCGGSGGLFFIQLLTLPSNSARSWLESPHSSRRDRPGLLARAVLPCSVGRSGIGLRY